MASIMKDFEFPQTARQGRTSPYAEFYPQWFNGEVWKLIRDTKNDDKKLSEVPLPKNTDYRAKTESMETLLRVAVKKFHNDKSWKLRTVAEPDSLVIQAYKSES